MLCELRRKQPNPGVVAWLQAGPAQALFLSVLTLGEIRKGIEGLPDATRRQALQTGCGWNCPATLKGACCHWTPTPPTAGAS